MFPYRPTFAVILLVLCIAGCHRDAKIIAKRNFIAKGRESVFVQTRSHFNVDYDSLSMGVIIKSIDGIAASKTAFWLYDVNGKSASVACDALIPNEGDTIEWRLELTW